jgi:phage shock protein PspC (stress-responsive transcriptional regulator)
MREFQRSYNGRKIWGICGGLGRYTSTDPFIWRILFFGLAFTPFPIVSMYVFATLLTNSIEFTD